MSQMLERVAEGVWKTSVPCATLPPYHHTHCYWIDTPQGLMLVDTGDGDYVRYLFQAYHELGEPRLKAVIMTHAHRDHVGGAALVWEKWHVPLCLDFKDQDLLDRDLLILPGWRNLGEENADMFSCVELISAPGHTEGQINLFLPTSGILIAGDNLLGNTTSVITPPHGHLRTYLKTLDRLQSLNARLALPAHGDVITDPTRYITLYRRHRFERLAQIRDVLNRKPLSANEIAKMIYPEAQRAIGERMIISHLQYLLEDKEITLGDDNRYARISS